MSRSDQDGNKYRVIDADGHAWEIPLRSWDRFLPEELRGKLFNSGIDANGNQRFLFDGKLFMACDTGKIPDDVIVQNHPLTSGKGYQSKDGSKGLPGMPTGTRTTLGKVPKGHPEDPDLHLQDLDAEGIDVAVVFPSMGLMLLSTDKLDLAIPCIRAENMWLADHAQPHADRMKPCISLPLVAPTSECVDACLRELDYAVNELGLTTVVHILPCVGPKEKANLDEPVFFPLFEEIERMGLPIGIHWSAGTHLPGMEDRFKPEQFFIYHTLGFPFENMIALSSIVCGGLLEKFPALKWGILESGCGWVYYLMERLDEHYELLSYLMPQMKKWPHDYMKSGLIYYSCDPDEQSIPFFLEMVGDDYLLYASDYPHWDGQYPGTVDTICNNPKLTPTQKRKVLGENAARFYGWHA